MEHITFCRICGAHCGMVASVEGADAEAHELDEGDVVRLSSKAGSLETAVKVTDEMTPGTVALPHGWGHRGGWRLANATPGTNVNVLASSDPEDLEPLAGMAFLNGIPVRLERVGSAGTGGAREPVADAISA